VVSTSPTFSGPTTRTVAASLKAVYWSRLLESVIDDSEAASCCTAGSLLSAEISSHGLSDGLIDAGSRT